MNRCLPLHSSVLHGRKQGFAAAIFLLWIGLWGAVSLGFAAPAGTVIRNQASASVGTQTYLSNEVESVVQAVCAASVTPDGSPTVPSQQAVISPGGIAYFTYRLQNLGNTRFDFGLSWSQTGPGWVPASVAIYQDVNGNGRRDPGELAVGTLSLDAGEAAGLVVEVRAPLGASGDAAISPVVSCPDGSQDANNYSRVMVGRGPALNVSKSVDRAWVNPGQEVGFTLKLANLGNAPALGPVYLTDLFNSPEFEGLSLVAGSATAAKGRLEYTADGSTWTASATPVRGIRLVLERLEAGEEALLGFRMAVSASAGAGMRENLARAEGQGGPAVGQAQFAVTARYGVFLGPGGNPRASGSADTQSATVMVAQPYCFAQTLENPGNATDRYVLASGGLPGGVSLGLRTSSGAELAQPIILAAGQHLDFQACLSAIPAASVPFAFTLTATSLLSGASDPTTDRVGDSLDPSGIVLRKSADAPGSVNPGQRVAYTLHFENPLPIALTAVVVEDALDPGLEFVSASDGGSYDAASRTVRWNLPSLPSHSARDLSLVTKVAEGAPDGSSLLNRFTLRSAEIPNPLLSQPVRLEVSASVLLLQKTVTPVKATPGDLLTYTLTLASQGRSALTVQLTDTPDPALAYVPGTAAPGEPEVRGGQLVWSNLTLNAGQTLTLTYKLRVLPGAPEKLLNVARAVGTTSSGSAVASAQATAQVTLQKGVFAPAQLLLGRVFLDTDRDGKYTAGVDLPLPGARVLLAGGWQALTDGEGRYSFRDLPGGVWEITLDPASAPFKPLPHPEASGDGYRHKVAVSGLTVSDFPLERPVGLGTVSRETALEFGPLKVAKKLLPLPAGVRVVLSVSSAQPLTDLTLSDPLPGGGEKTFHFSRFQGQETLTYDLPPGVPLTDPQARWRYP